MSPQQNSDEDESGLRNPSEHLCAFTVNSNTDKQPKKHGIFERACTKLAVLFTATAFALHFRSRVWGRKIQFAACIIRSSEVEQWKQEREAGCSLHTVRKVTIHKRRELWLFHVIHLLLCLFSPIGGSSPNRQIIDFATKAPWSECFKLSKAAIKKIGLLALVKCENMLLKLGTDSEKAENTRGSRSRRLDGRKLSENFAGNLNLGAEFSQRRFTINCESATRVRRCSG